jgi:hypothetical protein
MVPSPRHVRFTPNNGRRRWSTDPSYALPSDLKGAQTSNAPPVRSNSEGSSFSGLFTRVEMGHIVIGHGGGNLWTPMSLDVEKELLHVPVGNPAPDFYDKNRPSANLCTNSIVALDVRTGKLAWYSRLRGVLVSLVIGSTAGALLLLHAPIYAPMFPLVVTPRTKPYTHRCARLGLPGRFG